MNPRAPFRSCLWALALLPALPAPACKYNVRDAGFVDWNPQPYQLYACIQSNTPSTLTTALRNTAATLFLDANVRLQFVRTGQSPPDPAIPHALQASLPNPPALLLVSPEHHTLTLPFPSHPDQAPKDAWQLLENIVSSPARTTLLKRIVEAYAVVLLVEGTDPAGNTAATRSITEAIHRLNRLMERLPKAVKIPPEIMTLSPTQAAREEVLLWSLGITPHSTTPQAAVLYGRGRKTGPTLSSPILTEEVYQTLAILGQDCECSLDRSLMTGTMIPAAWDSELQSAVQSHAGFDAENPLVITEISRIMTRGPSSGSRPVGLPPPQGFDLDTLGYAEINVETLVEAPAEQALPTAPTPAPPEKPQPPAPPAATLETPANPVPSTPRYNKTWLTLGAIGALALGGSLLILLRRGGSH